MNPDTHHDNTIILDENGNILLFSSRTSAEGYLEPVDVRNAEYIGYDGTGRMLTLVAVPSGAPTGEAVRIELAEPQPAHAEELRAKLVLALQRTDSWKDELQHATLDRVVSVALQQFKVR